ncbi:MAG: sulfatase, partial [Planctomycetes bacterium]|nr:sulfatase [Planctomycetota bacterium]
MSTSASTPRATVRLVALALAVGLLAGCGDETSPRSDGAAAPDEASHAPRHFLLVSIDTLRADRLSCYGYERPTSPHLDAFAADSLLFEQCTSAATNTTPSHMSMFTGLVPPIHGQYNIELGSDGQTNQAPVLLPPTMPMLAERLSQAGFATAAFTDGGYLTPELKFDRGFDVFERKAETVDKKVDHVLEFLKTLDWTGKRQFVFFHTYEVHAPYVPPREHDLFTDATYDGPIRERLEKMREVVGRGGVAGARQFLPTPREATPADTKFLSDLYDGGVHFTDAEVGRLIEAVRASRYADDIAILVLSDHGDAFNEHGTFGHGELFHTVTHVPFILHVPGGPTGRVTTPISGVDVTPTVLDVLGLPEPEITDGVSVLSSLDPMRTILSYRGAPEHGGGMSFRKGDFKLLRGFAGKPWQRYDLGDDYDERNPLPADTVETSKALAIIEALEKKQRSLS